MLGAAPSGRKAGAKSASRRGWLPLREFDDLPQQLPDKGRALAALRLFPQGAIDRRYRAALALGVGAKVAVGNRVAETNVHARPLDPSGPPDVAELRSTRNIISAYLPCRHLEMSSTSGDTGHVLDPLRSQC
jgi:hypothetical protein